MQDKKITLRYSKMCRGMWKIYALVELPQELLDCDFDAIAQLKDGSEVPSNLLPYDETHRVLVLAVLSATQYVTITARAQDGSTAATFTRRVQPAVAKASSQVHTMLGDAGMEQIRNYDSRPLFGQYEIRLQRIVQRYDGTESVQGDAYCSSNDFEALSSDIEIVVVDSSGTVVSIGDAVLLRDVTAPVQNTCDCYERQVQFSVRIPAQVETFLIWMRPRAKGDGVYAAMYTVDPGERFRWREEWTRNTLPASANKRYTDEYHKERWNVSASELAVQRRTTLRVNPKFSIIVPLYKTPLAYLDEMIESVVEQSYQNLELVLVNASPEDTALCEAVNRWRKADARIVSVPLFENFGITENTNAGIRAATGDFLCFLDHDDVLSREALFCYAQALEQYPTTDMFYSDEDHIENGEHKHVYFKPDWEPDLLLGMNYVCHFLAVRRSVVDGFELPTREFDGAQDHHMALRVSEVARNIYHCRKVLYHWRIHPGSTARAIDEKPYAIEAGRKAVQAHLDRCGLKAKAILSERIPTRYEVIYENEDAPLVSILIPNKDAVPVLDRCIQSLLQKTTYQNYEIVIIENNSTDDETFAYYKRAEAMDERVRVVYYPGSFNYAKINNFGARQAKGDYLLMLNNDTEVVTPEWLDRMVGVCRRVSTGIVGAKLLYPDDTIQHAGVIALPGGPDHANRSVAADTPWETVQLTQDVSAVTGACLLVSRAVFDEMGGLDETFEVDYNDVDFCWRVGDAGYLIVYEPSAVLYHYESVSRGFHGSHESQMRFEREKALLRSRWPERFAYTDHMSNPNFDKFAYYYILP